MTPRRLRLIFFGTPDYAVPTLERLLSGPHPVVGVVSQPNRRRGRGRRLSPSPVAQLALQRSLPLYRPERVGSIEAELREQLPDLGVVVAFGQFIPKPIRELPRLGYCINGHASLLPRYRGAAPIARALLNGETRTGVSVMRVERGMDTGPCALVRELEIGAEETAGELEARMASLTADAIEAGLAAIAEGRVHWTHQDERLASEAPKLEREEARLDWSQPVAALANRVRAFSPSPGAFSQAGEETLRILRARPQPGPVSAPPGCIRRRERDRVEVACSDGWLELLELQRPGGKAMSTSAFLRGRDLPDGLRLG